MINQTLYFIEYISKWLKLIEYVNIPPSKFTVQKYNPLQKMLSKNNSLHGP